MTAHLHPRAVDTLARTLYGEARGEPWAGKIAVGWVVRNRAERGGWWGESVIAVCLAPKQFSCWNDTDPNRAKLMGADLSLLAFAECQRAALAVLSGAKADPTGGATHYHAESVAPAWARGKTPCAAIGHHLFYRGIA